MITVRATRYHNCTSSRTAHFIRSGHVVDERGALRVNKSFQVEGYENIFAMGDCSGSGDAWVSFLAMEHAKMVAQNIVKLQKKEPLKTYKGRRLNKYIYVLRP